MATIVIGCKLPHGIELSGSQGQKIKLNGVNTSLVAGGFGITHVDKAEAAYLFSVYEDFGPFKSNAIFTNEDAKVANLADLANDLKNEPTGFEAMDPSKPGKGLEAETNVDKALEQAERQPRPSKAPAAPADKAAANELAGNA